jgi:hypothetical protein
MDRTENKPDAAQEFAREGSKQRSSFLGEYLFLLRSNRKWWMLPLLLVLLGFGALMVLSTSGAAPFIYTLF